MPKRKVAKHTQTKLFPGVLRSGRTHGVTNKVVRGLRFTTSGQSRGRYKRGKR